VNLTEARKTRKMVWDIVPCNQVRDFMPPMDLIPGSDDVTEMEHRESHARLDRVAPLADRLHGDCEMAARVVTSIMLRLDTDSEVDPETVEIVVEQNSDVIFSGMAAILAQLIDEGVVQIGTGA
jgi:hypothetical protein